jgi:hypothetical protein
MLETTGYKSQQLNIYFYPHMLQNKNKGFKVAQFDDSTPLRHKTAALQ